MDKIKSAFINNRLHNFYGHKKHVYELQKAIMLNNIGLEKNLSVICDNNFIPVSFTMDEHIYWNPKCMGWFYKNKPTDEDIRNEIEKRKKTIVQYVESRISSDYLNLDGTYVDLTHAFGFYAYGHLFDTLQRLFFIQDLIKENVKFIVSDYKRIFDFQYHLSALCGKQISENDLINSRTFGKNFLIENLIYALSPNVPTQMSQETYNWILNRYQTYFNATNPQPKYNLYLDRNHIQKDKRGVLNNKEVIDFLVKKYDFIILNGSEPLKDIVYYFSNAAKIVGTHGSLFANTMFCNPETSIIEYCPKNRMDMSFKNKYKLANNYTQIITEADENYNVHINIDNLIKLI